MLELFISNLITRFEEANQYNFEEQGAVDLFGRAALQKMAKVMGEAGRVAKVSNKLGKLTVFALIRLVDSRNAVIEFIRHIENHCDTAWISATGAYKEWKFMTVNMYEIIKEIRWSLEKEVEAVEKHTKLYKRFVSKYDGSPLGIVQWQQYERIRLKRVLDKIIRAQDDVWDNLRKLRDELNEYYNTENAV